MDRLIAQYKQQMQASVAAVQAEFDTIRTGRASPAILDRLRVDYYGSQLPINQLATIGAPEPRLLVITAWDKSAVSAIEKAIMTSDLGLTPASEGNVIRLAIPSLTEERREELGKLVNKKAEEGRTVIRNTRRDANEGIDKMEKKEGLSEDEVEVGKREVQQMTDDFAEQIDELAEKKIVEIMEI